MPRLTASSRSMRSAIRYGLGAIKGTGEQAIEAIVAARKAGGPFRDLFDFCRRVDKRVGQPPRHRGADQRRRVRRIDARRATLFASVGVAIDEAERAEAVGAPGIAVRRGAQDRWPRSSPPASGPTPSASRTKRRRSASTCRAIPSRRYAAELAPLVTTSLANLAPTQERFLVAGIVTALRIQQGGAARRRSSRWTTARAAEITVWNETFDAARRCCARTSWWSSR